MRFLAEFQLPSIQYFANWVASWLEPLSNTRLGFVKWEAESRDTGAYIAILLVVVLLVARVIMGRRRKVAVFFAASILMLLLLIANVVLSASNNQFTEQQQILFWRDSVWKWAYAFFCAWIPAFVVTATYLVGTLGGAPPGGGGSPGPGGGGPPGST
jgi:hypothetical protein